jgi:hypothetical protein
MLTHDRDTENISKGNSNILQTRPKLRNTNYNIHGKRT